MDVCTEVLAGACVDAVGDIRDEARESNSEPESSINESLEKDEENDMVCCCVDS